MLTIALDYDETYTADPDLWIGFVRSAQRRGHKVVCVTRRRSPPADDEPKLPPGVPIVCCVELDQYKRAAALAAGYKVDIWIDDLPELIGETLILDWR